MTRDEIALKAMEALIIADHVKREDIPHEAYRIADAMLEISNAYTG
jgi:hypothetical protein